MLVFVQFADISYGFIGDLVFDRVAQAHHRSIQWNRLIRNRVHRVIIRWNWVSFSLKTKCCILDYSIFRSKEEDFDAVSMSLDRGFTGSPSLGWRRSRFPRMARRNLTPSRSNSLLHSRSLNIQRRKPSLLSRIFHGRTFQCQMRSVTNHSPISAATSPPATNQETGQRSSDQVLPSFSTSRNNN